MNTARPAGATAACRRRSGQRRPGCRGAPPDHRQPAAGLTESSRCGHPHPRRSAKTPLRFVLTAVVTPSGIASVLTRSAAHRRMDPAVVDDSGTIIARTREPERFVGQRATAASLDFAAAAEGIFSDVALDGAEVTAAFSRGRLTGWVSAVAVQRAVLEAPLRRSMLLAGGFAVLLLGLGGAGAFLSRAGSRTQSSRRLTRLTRWRPASRSSRGSRRSARWPALATRWCARLRCSTRTSDRATTTSSRSRLREPKPKRRTAPRTSSWRCSATSCATRSRRSLTALQLMRIARRRPAACASATIIERQVRHLSGWSTICSTSRASRAARSSCAAQPLELRRRAATPSRSPRPLIERAAISLRRSTCRRAGCRSTATRCASRRCSPTC